MKTYTPRGLHLDHTNPATKALINYFGSTEHYIQYLLGKFNHREDINKFTATMDIEDMFSDLQLLPQAYKWELCPEDLRVSFISVNSIIADLKDEAPEVLDLPVYDAMAFVDAEGTPMITVNVDRVVGIDSYLYDSIMSHELVHIHQLIRGDMTVTNGELYWKGEHWDYDRVTSHMDEHAKDRHTVDLPGLDTLAKESTLPWELEAYGETLPTLAEDNPAYKLFEQIKAEWRTAKNK